MPKYKTLLQLLLISTVWLVPSEVVSFKIFELLHGLHYTLAEPIQLILLNPSSEDFSELESNKFIQNTELQIICSFTKELFCDVRYRDSYKIVLSNHHSFSEIKTFLSNISAIDCESAIVWNPIVILIFHDKLSEFSSETEFLKKFQTNAGNFRFDSNIFIAINENSYKEFLIYELYKLKNTAVVEKILIQKYIAGGILQTIRSKIRRYNLRLDKMRNIVYTDGSPRLEASVLRTIDSLKLMSTLLNFSTEIVKGDGWISFAPNGSLKGIGRELESGEVDLTPQYSELSLKRAQKLDFIFPTVFHREEAFFIQPSSVYENILLQPYTTELWIAFSMSFITFTVTAVIIKQYRYCAKSIREFLNDISESLLWTTGLFAQQGCFEAPSYFSLKLLTACGLLLTMSAYYVYAASILSIIISREPPIKNYNQLFNSGMEIMVDFNSQNAYRFIEEQMSHHKSAESIQGRILTGQEGVIRIMKTGTAFFTYQDYLYDAGRKANISFQHFCNVVSKVSLNAKGLPVYNGMYATKNSPFRKMFHYAHVRMGEMGILQRIRVSSASPACVKPSSNLNCFEPLTFSVVAPSFVILTVVMSIAVIFLFVEIINDRYSYIQKHFPIRLCNLSKECETTEVVTYIEYA